MRAEQSRDAIYMKIIKKSGSWETLILIQKEEV